MTQATIGRLMNKKKPRHILKILRTLLDIDLNKIRYKNNSLIMGIPYYESLAKNPLRSTVESIAYALKLNPDILFYSFGFLPEKERQIIISDPFFYSEKIKELCNNHENRYESKVDMEILNIKRCAEYIEENTINLNNLKDKQNENIK
jgi:hypothetical protein